MNALQLCPDSFHTGVTAKALPAKIERKSTMSQQRGQFDPNFRYKGLPPTDHFCTVS